MAYAAQIPAKYTYEDVASFPCAGGAAYLGLFAPNPLGMGIPNPLAERMQELGDTIVIIGGSSSVGQYGALLLASRSNRTQQPRSNPILQTRRLLQHHYDRFYQAQPSPQINGRNTRHRPPTTLPSHFCRDIGNHGRPTDHVRL